MRQRASGETGPAEADRPKTSRSPLILGTASEADLTRVPLYAAAAPRHSGAGADAERAAERAAAGDASALGTSGSSMPAAGLRPLGSGSPLPDEVRVEAEALLGSDFADVRIHTDDKADRAARLEGSTAFTQGTDIAFRQGAWAPASPAGRQLIHHELGHVTQQRAQGAVGLQRQQSRDWQAVADTLTADELSAEVDRLNLLLQGAIESNDLTLMWMNQLSVYERALAARRGGQQAVRGAAEANRQATRSAVAGTESTAEAALVTAFALDQSVQGLFGAGFYTGFQAQIPPAEITEFTTELQQNFGSFYGGYLVGLPIGLGRGLVSLIEGLGTLIQLGIALSPPALLAAGAEEAFSLITSREHRALRRAQYEQLQRFRAALVELMNDFSSDPTVLMSWSSEVGIAAGEGFGQAVTDEFFRTTIFEQGKMLGVFVGQVAFEVLLEILLAVATTGIGNALRAATAAGQGVRAGGRLAGLLRRLMEASPRVRRLVDILTDLSGAVRRTPVETPGEALPRHTPTVETRAPATRPPEPVPEAEVPRTVAPEPVPEAEVPRPGAEVPETMTPETVTPETVTPVTVTPETVTPETVTPQTATRTRRGGRRAGAPTVAETVTRTLEDAGFEPWEINVFAGRRERTLTSASAARVARLLEKFTPADLRALAHVMEESDTFLTDGMVKALLEHAETGKMDDFLSRYSPDDFTFADVQEAEAPGMSMTEENVRRQRTSQAQQETPNVPQQDPLWRLAEQDTGPALEDRFGPGWEAGRRFPAPGAAQGETLGSTVPEYFHPDLNVAVEVKRFNLLEAGIDPANPAGLGTPSPESVEAFNRAARQAAARRWAIPGQQGAGPPQIWMVFDIRGQGVTDVDAVGTGLRTLLNQHRISFDQLMLLTPNGLVDVP